MNDSRWVVSPASVEMEASRSKRPRMLWAVVALTLVPVVFALLASLLTYFITTGEVHERIYGGWTINIYLQFLLPPMITIVGVVLLVRMSRWAFVPFAVLLLRASYYFAVNLPKEPFAKYAWLSWAPTLFVIGTLAIATAYCLFRLTVARQIISVAEDQNH